MLNHDTAVNVAKRMQAEGYLHVNERVKRQGTATEEKRMEAQADSKRVTEWGGRKYTVTVLDGQISDSDQLVVGGIDLCHMVSSDVLDPADNRPAPNALTPAYNHEDQLVSLGEALKRVYVCQITYDAAADDVTNAQDALVTAEAVYQRESNVHVLKQVGEASVRLVIAKRSLVMIGENLRLAKTQLENMRNLYVEAWIDHDSKRSNK